jgi:hypothetical protein
LESFLGGESGARGHQLATGAGWESIQP